MDALQGLGEGFAVALDPMNLLLVFVGVTVGTLIGLLPGLGPVATIALLLPLTFNMEPASAIMMLAGIYYGSMYGGRIPAILLRLPGDASAVVTTFDGFPLTQQGRAGPALGITAIGSFIGGTIAIIGLTLLAPVLAGVAGQVQAADLFVLAALGLLMVTMIGSGSKAKSIAGATLGMLVAVVGLDPITAEGRLTFGNIDLIGGIHIVAVAVGLFGLGEILHSADQGFYQGMGNTKLNRVMPTKADWIQTRFAILRASVLGFFIGVIPGGGGTISSVMAYGVEKRFSRHPERFGRGAIDGLAATETADNASSNSAFIPLLTLGVPPNPVLALIFGALLLHNITPGPNLIEDSPDVFWGVIASMYIGNVLLLVLNLPLIGVFTHLLRIRGAIMAPIIAIVAVAGVYSVRNSVFDIIMCVLFGAVGYMLRVFNFNLGPFILGFILGPILELQFRRSMMVSDGSLTVFVERPLAQAVIALAVLGMLWYFISRYLRRDRTPLIMRHPSQPTTESLTAVSSQNDVSDLKDIERGSVIDPSDTTPGNSPAEPEDFGPDDKPHPETESDPASGHGWSGR